MRQPIERKRFCPIRKRKIAFSLRSTQTLGRQHLTRLIWCRHRHAQTLDDAPCTTNRLPMFAKTPRSAAPARRLEGSRTAMHNLGRFEVIINNSQMILRSQFRHSSRSGPQGKRTNSSENRRSPIRDALCRECFELKRKQSLRNWTFVLPILRLTLPLAALCTVALALSACGGSGGSATSTAGATTGSSNTNNSSTSGGSSTTGGSSSGSTSGSGGSGSGTTSGGSGSSGNTGSSSGPAAALAAKLGLSSRLLVGLGSQPVSTILSQGLKPDILDQYLVGVGSGDWTTWNSPSGAYVGVVASQAEQVGAIPMYTLYQMAANGDGNLADLNDTSFMTAYWSNIKLMYQQIAVYGKPALVNLEPDFWGYAERQSNQNPTSLAAKVSINADCASLSNDIVGIAGCLVKMARQYAPKAYIGFPISDWGGDNAAQVVTFMQAVGASNADFIVIMTLDRDAGCFETSPLPSDCARGGGPYYWDETNQTTPNFTQHLASVQQYHSGLGDLPAIWWQTPMGVPSSTPGGTPGHYRDNREDYFLKHPSELTAAGGLAVVFSAGDGNQTTLASDGGQFQALSSAYFNAPSPLP